MYILLAIMAGVSIVLSRIINFNLADRIGVFPGTFFNYMFGLIFSGIVLAFSNENIISNINNLGNIPWWAYLGGFVGIGVIALSNYVTPKISVFYLTIFIFIGQLLIGGVIDYIVLHELSIGKVIGGILVLVGLIYNVRLDNIESTDSMKITDDTKVEFTALEE